VKPYELVACLLFSVTQLQHSYICRKIEIFEPGKKYYWELKDANTQGEVQRTPFP